MRKFNVVLAALVVIVSCGDDAAAPSRPGPPAAIVVQGGGQTALAGTALPAPVLITVTDQAGKPVAGVQATFTVTAGLGTLAEPTTVTTDAMGNATAPTWTLGKRNIPQQLTVSAGGVTQTIDATIQTEMRISLRFFGGISAAHQAVFEGAAARLTAMIVKGAAPVQVNNYDVAGICGVEGEPPLTATIDGIIIFASIRSIDGPGNVLAQAGPCAFRNSAGQFLPAIGTIQFDIDDLPTLTGGGSLESVAMHEMMHAMGSGTLWRIYGILEGFETNDPRYTGTWGVTGCRNLGGLATCAADMPVENTGGAGTKNSHWRESSFANELMTGFINAGNNPMSAMSVLSMQDIGYVGNVAAADAYSVAAGLRTLSAAITTNPEWEELITVELPDDLVPHGGLLRPRPQ